VRERKGAKECLGHLRFEFAQQIRWLIAGIGFVPGYAQFLYPHSFLPLRIFFFNKSHPEILPGLVLVAMEMIVNKVLK